MPDEKIALITGANKGIGFEVARQLGKLGITVLVAARDEVRGRKAEESLREGGTPARYVFLDVTEPETASKAAAWVEAEYGRLDILVNNAAISGSFMGPPSEASSDQLRDVYETNVFGVVTVTNAMLPLLRRSAAGRIVNMSSDAGSLALNADPGSPFAGYSLLTYQSSKAALNFLTVAYAKELRDTPIKVNSANPGFTATDLNGHRGYGTTEQASVIVVRLATLGPDGPTGTSQNEKGDVPW